MTRLGSCLSNQQSVEVLSIRGSLEFLLRVPLGTCPRNHPGAPFQPFRPPRNSEWHRRHSGCRGKPSGKVDLLRVWDTHQAWTSGLASAQLCLLTGSVALDTSVVCPSGHSTNDDWGFVAHCLSCSQLERLRCIPWEKTKSWKSLERASHELGAVVSPAGFCSCIMT